MIIYSIVVTFILLLTIIMFTAYVVFNLISNRFEVSDKIESYEKRVIFLLESFACEEILANYDSGELTQEDKFSRYIDNLIDPDFRKDLIMLIFVKIAEDRLFIKSFMRMNCYYFKTKKVVKHMAEYVSDWCEHFLLGTYSIYNIVVEGRVNEIREKYDQTNINESPDLIMRRERKRVSGIYETILREKSAQRFNMDIFSMIYSSNEEE